MKNVSNYKDSLSQKTVDELVEIILRKDDKEHNKNKQISALELKINHLKRDIVELSSDINSFNKRYKEITTEAHNFELNYQRVKTAYDKAVTQNTILRIIIALLGAIAIIELLIITIV